MSALSWNDKAPEKIMHATQIHQGGMPTYFEYVRVDVIEAENAELRTNLRHWRDECGKLHAQIRGLREGTPDGENMNRLEAIEAAARRLAYIVRKSVNAGPASNDPTSEGQAWRALRAALGERYDEKGELA